MYFVASSETCDPNGHSRSIETMNKRARFYLLVIISIFLAFVLLDSVGIFDNKSYNEVPHGSHTHYVPKDCDPPLGVSDSPTRRPAANERIDCQGNYVTISE